MRKIIIVLASIAAVGAAVNVLGLKDRREQAAGQWCEIFNDERDYYGGSEWE